MGKFFDFFKDLFEHLQRYIEDSVFRNMRKMRKEFVNSVKDLKCDIEGLVDSAVGYRCTVSVPGWANRSLEEKLLESKIEFSRQDTGDDIYFVFKNKKDVDYALSLYPAIEKEIEDVYYENVYPRIVEIPIEMRLQTWDLCKGCSFSILENLDDPNKLNLVLPSKEDADFYRNLMSENRLDELRDGKVLLPSIEKERAIKQQSPTCSDKYKAFERPTIDAISNHLSKSPDPGAINSDRYAAFERKEGVPSLDSVIKKCTVMASEQSDRYKPLRPSIDNVL